MAKGDKTLAQQALAACRGAFLAVGLFSFCVNLLMLTLPLYMLQVFDRVLSSRSEETLIVLSIVAAGAFLTLAILDAVRAGPAAGRHPARHGDGLTRLYLEA